MKNDKIQHTEKLFNKITAIIEQARQKVATSVNIAMVYTYYEIGRYIVEDEQQGQHRAKYGKAVLKEPSKQLTKRFGKGFSEDGLERMKKFYSIYSKQISATVLRKSQNTDTRLNNLEASQRISDKSYDNLNTVYPIQFTLSWSHYLILMRVENPNARSFYEIEAAKQQWSVRQLARQCDSSFI